MVSPFEVYLVMQLDSFVTLLAVAGALSILGGGFALIEANTSFGNKEWAAPARKVILSGIAAAFLAAIIPSSKTAAAMIVIPALTSADVVEPVGREAREVYALAKKALRNLADEPKESGD